MNGKYFLALDAGSGSGRAAIFDARGREVGFAQQEWTHAADPAHPGALDFDCAANGPVLDRLIGDALAQSDIPPDEISAVSTTSMREGTVWYDKDGAVLWACPNVDSRAGAEAKELADCGMADKIFRIAGDWVSITTPARVRWLAKHRPDVIEKTRVIGLLSDWAATRLTGEFMTEPSAGSSTGLFDLSQRTWSDTLLDLLELDKSICPDVVESGSEIGRVTPEAAARCGLKVGTPVYAGGGDTQLALIGLGRPVGASTLVGGTHWQFAQVIDRPIVDPRRGPRTLCHARPGQWMIEGIGVNSGFALRWLRDAFFADMPAQDVFRLMEEGAAKTPPGANGVQAILSSPMKSDSWTHPSPTLLGFDLGDPANTGRAAVVRAVMEAGAYVSQAHRALVSDATGVPATEICFTGGSTRGALWAQIIADVMDLPVHVSGVAESTSLGCAMLAAVGSGHYASLEDAAPMTSGISRTVQPDAGRAAQYKEHFEQWKKIDHVMADLARRDVTRSMWKAAGWLENPA